MKQQGFFLLILTVGIAFLFSCKKVRNPNKLAAVEKVCNNLYAEKYYYHQGGVYGGELLDVYLTDSLHFWKFVGVIDEKEYFSFECRGKEINVTKIDRRLKENKKTDYMSFKIKDLIEEGKN